MRNVRKRGEIAIEILEFFSHQQKLLKMIAIPREGTGAAVCRNDGDAAFERQSQAGRRFQIVSTTAHEEFPTGMSQQGQSKFG